MGRSASPGAFLRIMLPLPIVAPPVMVFLGSIAKLTLFQDWELVLVMSALLGALPYAPVAATLWHISRYGDEHELRRAVLLAPIAMSLLMAIASTVLTMSIHGMLILGACGLVFGYAYVVLGFVLLALARALGIVRFAEAR